MNISNYPHTASMLGADLSIYWIIPFVGILLSIAILPLIKPALWHHNYGRISIFWSLSFLAPLTLLKGVGVALYHFLDVLLLEYLPFILFCAVPVLPPTSYPFTSAKPAVPSFVETTFLNAKFTLFETSSSKILLN